MPLQIGKTPIVVPRQHQFNEHVNDHQVEFARNVAQRMGTIIPVEDINTLGDIITNYDQIVAGMGHEMSSNNSSFNNELEKIVEEIAERKKAYAPLREESRRLEIASDNVYSIFRKTNEMKSDLAWKREWEANVRERARQEQARQEQRERQPKRKKRSYDMSL